jgi:hypothetical protein
VNLISEYRFDVLEDILSLSKSLKQETKELNTAPKEQISKLKVQVVESVPKFVGVDLEIYGPFNANEELELNKEIAEMLVKTNKAKIM